MKLQTREAAERLDVGRAAGNGWTPPYQGRTDPY
jgi:hypothetical protein